MPFVVDASGRGLPTGTLARRGVLALLLVMAVVAALLLQYKGYFRATFPASALVADVGDGVAAGADVKLRGALVGTVGDVRLHPGSDGRLMHTIDLDLRPDMAAGIPSGVTARVVPTNVFGAPAVELVDTRPGGAGRRLARGAVIPGDDSEQTLQLQTVMNRLNGLLRAVHPAQLDLVLTNVAQAVQGRGERIGSLITRLDGYLTTLNGHTDDLNADVALLGSSLQGLADNAPALLDTVDNAVVSSRTLVDKQQHLADALTGATATADDLGGFLSDNDDRIIRVLHNSVGIADTVAEHSEDIPKSLASLGQGTKLLASGLRRPGGLSLRISLTPFSPYTSADCPRYPGLNGPNCGRPEPPPDPTIPAPGPSGAVPTPPTGHLPSNPAQSNPAQSNPLPANPLLPSRTPPTKLPSPKPAPPNSLFDHVFPSAYLGGSIGPVGSPAEVRTIDALLGTPATGAAGTLLLGPIVRGATVVTPA